MKTKSFTLLLFYSITYTAFAQYIEQENKKENKWQVSINVNKVEPITEAGFDAYVAQTRLFDPADHKKDKSYSVGLNVGYQVKGNCVIRLATKITNYIIDETWDLREVKPFVQSNYLVDVGHVRQTVYSFSPGLLWGLNYKKIYFHCGFQLVYKNYGPVNTTLSYTNYNSSNNAFIGNTNYFLI